MRESYLVLDVSPYWMIDPESMGSKEKFWYRDPSDETSTDWLFKFPRSGSGEHWAEKIAAELAHVLNIPHARVELATCGGIKGSTSQSFTGAHWELFHGNQLLELRLDNYSVESRRPLQHTLSNICEVLSSYGDASEKFVEYLILDSIVGNTDRHHENWGVLLDAN